jgi:hypothetical protein
MPKNMKYDAVATKAAGPKKKMKSNQDGGSVTAKDPAAAGKQLMADQKGAAKYKKGPAMGHKKGPAKYDRVVLGGNKGDVSKTKPGKKDYDGSAKMGYSQKFGAGRMNGYDMGAAKVADIMKNGPAQMKDVKSGKRVNVKTSDDKTLSVVSGSGFHQQALNQGSVIQSIRPNYPEGDPYEANLPDAEKTRRKQATYPKK